MTSFWQHALINSLLVVSGVSILSILISLPAAWLVERTDMPGGRLLEKLLSLPYVVPSYLLAISWITLANPTVGWINLMAKNFFGASSLINIYNIGGIIFIEASALFAILFLSFLSGLRKMDPSLEEAARLSGASPLRIFFKITCPLLKNTIVSSLIAISLASLASFGVPAMIGGPARVFVLTTGIFSLLKQGSSEGQTQALVIALEMGLAAVVLVFVSRIFSKQQYSLVGGKTSRPALVQLGALRKPLAALLWSIWILVAALPIVALIISSFQSNPGSMDLSQLSLRAWDYVLFSLPDFHTAVFNSIVVSVIAAFVVLAISVPVALLSWKGHFTKGKQATILSRIIEDSALLVYSLPGTVLAVLLIFAATKFSFLGLADTLGIIIVALVLKYLTLGFRTVGPATFLIHPSLIEAAQLSGASFLSRLKRIWFPLLRPSLVATGLLILMPCVAELTMSILLYGPGTETLGVQLFQLQEYADRASAAVVGTLLLLAVILFQVVVGRLLRER